jgi:hypothetical protein
VIASVQEKVRPKLGLRSVSVATGNNNTGGKVRVKVPAPAAKKVGARVTDAANTPDPPTKALLVIDSVRVPVRVQVRGSGIPRQRRSSRFFASS